jgi:hypothetical protein
MLKHEGGERRKGVVKGGMEREKEKSMDRKKNNRETKTKRKRARYEHAKRLIQGKITKYIIFIERRRISVCYSPYALFLDEAYS